MKEGKQHKPPGDDPRLRERAEALLSRTGQAPRGVDAVADPDALIYELSVHQLELEMQNEELRQAQLELAAARDRYADLYHYAPVGYLALDRQGNIVEANRKVATLLGVNPGDLAGAKLSKYVQRDFQDDFYLHRQAVFSGAAQPVCEIEMLRAGGRRWYARLESRMDTQARTCQTVLIDISKRRTAERELIASEKRFRVMADGLPSIIWVIDSAGRLEFTNRAYNDYFSVDEEQICVPEWRWQQLVHPDDEAAYGASVKRALNNRCEFYERVRVRRGNGRWRWIESRGQPRFSDSGEFLGMVGSSNDIDERVRAEQDLLHLQHSLQQQVAERTEELEVQREFIEIILENQPMPVMVLDSQHRLLLFNRACETASGFDFEELHGGADWLLLFPEDERAEIESSWDRFPGRLQPEYREYHWIHKDGSQRLMCWYMTALKHDDGGVRYIIASGLDITEQREAEQKARESLEHAARLQRILAANELAAVLVHEITQPLTAISMFADAGHRLMSQQPLDSQLIGNNLKRISDEAIRCGETLHRIHSFIEKGRIESAPIDVHAALGLAIDRLQPKARKYHIRVRLQPEDDVLMVQGVAIHVEQVMYNLLRNAIEAVREVRSSGGEVEVRTRLHTRDGRRVVRVTVRDNGAGIAAEQVARLFEPLYSSKDHGMGMGLRISRSLVKSMGGRLWVEPQQPGGVFHFEMGVAK